MHLYRHGPERGHGREKEAAVQQKDREKKGHQQFPSALGVVELPEVRINATTEATGHDAMKDKGDKRLSTKKCVLYDCQVYHCLTFPHDSY